jgi:hypothetical protein
MVREPLETMGIEGSSRCLLVLVRSPLGGSDLDTIEDFLPSARLVIASTDSVLASPASSLDFFAFLTLFSLIILKSVQILKEDAKKNTQIKKIKL